MNFTYLKYFMDTVNEGSVQSAAALNFVSQPAISQGIKRLETDLEIDLLNHKRNSIDVTKDGKAVFNEARELFSSIRKYQNEVNKIKNKISGELNIGISNSLVPICLSPALSQFTKDYPEVEVKVRLGKTSTQTELLEDGDIDFGITIKNESLKAYETQVLKKGKFFLYYKQQAPKNLLITETRPETKELMRSLRANRDFPFEKVLEIESWTTIKELICAGYGYGLIPDFLINPKEAKEFELKKKKLDSIPYEIVSFNKAGADLLLQNKYLSICNNKS